MHRASMCMVTIIGVSHLCNALTQAGINTTGFSSHSFGINCIVLGMSDSLVQTLGRWKSAAFTAYIRKRDKEVAAASAHLAHTLRS